MSNILGTNIASSIVPFTTDDTYPTHDEEYGRGGWRTVGTATDLQNIPAGRLKDGMAVFVRDVELLYVYNESTSQFVSFGSLSSAVTTLGFKLWSELSAYDVTNTMDAAVARVIGDTGTHTDPVTATTDVANEGVYRFHKTGTIGWERIGNLESVDVQNLADEVQTNADAINDKLTSISDRSGYLGGWQTPDGTILLGFRISDGLPIFANGGDIVGRIAALEALGLSIINDPRSGWIIAFKTADGTLPFSIDRFSGRTRLLGRDVLGELNSHASAIALLQASVANPIADFPSNDILAIGDSLTANTGTSNWVNLLASYLNVNVYQGGIGGQGIQQINGRFGTPALVETAFTIPADTSSVSVSVNGYTPCSASTSRGVTIAGIAGTLTRDSGTGHTFARTLAGSAVAVAAKTQIFDNAALNMRNRTLIIGEGRNSLPWAGSPVADVSVIIAAIRANIDYLTPRNKRVIVWGIPPFVGEEFGTSKRTTLDAWNAAIAAAFPEYWVDVPSYVRTTDAATVAGITFTDQDNTDIANGLTPTSFRNVTDGVVDPGHFNGTSSPAIAGLFQTTMTNRGWL